ncbi:response regulator [Massilia yuzhufengensis]|uniref:Two-component system, chemotaxis family, response regulator CheY n=1 Tax=Massilia yuzhufengensis TaxID=1164594 RepID=A0A1I1P7X1_9BURK|nr:response regulator [Massilia yuzhufengensis]SFD05815.1 two-component system, chemotaxis family, response regulator CheY [Massilia yuzhufengensis]
MKVLVVDDDVVSRMMLMHLVDSCGQYQIVEAEDGEDAWRQLAAGLRPALVFCDLRMPNLGGLELLVRLRADPALAALPFVLVSAASDAHTLEQAGRLGADGYIGKPFAVDQVRAQLARLQQDEEPQTVLQRLGIPLERLQLYLAGLQRQLEEAGTGLADAPQRAQRLQRLAEGCATLGLAGSAARLRAIGAADGPEALQAALAHALGALMRQQQRAQAGA